MPFDKIPLGADASAKLASITDLYNSLESALMLLADCREKALAITNLEQSYLWMEKTIDREQLWNLAAAERMERRLQTKIEIAPIPMQPPLSPHAAILAESKAKLDGLAASIKELTDTVVTTGFSLKG